MRRRTFHPGSFDKSPKHSRAKGRPHPHLPRTCSVGGKSSRHTAARDIIRANINGRIPRKPAAISRPYRTRMALGICFGVFYRPLQRVLVLAVRVVTDWFFSGRQVFVVKQDRVTCRNSGGTLQHWVPQISSPTTRTGIALAVCSIPLVMAGAWRLFVFERLFDGLGGRARGGGHSLEIIRAAAVLFP